MFGLVVAKGGRKEKGVGHPRKQAEVRKQNVASGSRNLVWLKYTEFGPTLNHEVTTVEHLLAEGSGAAAGACLPHPWPACARGAAKC